MRRRELQPRFKNGKKGDLKISSRGYPNEPPNKSLRRDCVPFIRRQLIMDLMLLLRSVFFTFLQPGVVTVLIPYWLISSRGAGVPFGYEALRYLGFPLIVIGTAGLLWCIWDFFSAG